ncbi:MAG: glucose-6-phosphate dehydrogenase [Actinobacteria bacterium]|nr:glucose-6-phosphate dehydrogenase [Actinomycetota bacterium]
MVPAAARANPLRDPRDRRLPRVPEPCALVVFGVTGDLARKKLLPAIYDLANRGLLPADFVLLGFARRDWEDGDFESLAKKAAKEHARTNWNDEVWDRLAGDVKFVPGSFDDDEAFDTLASTLDELRHSHGIKGNAAFYLSIPPSMFPVVLKQMERTKMADNAASGGWRRVVVEKPFGHDLPSAVQLNDLVDDVFTADDVFRIDHYLGKETVQNLMALRFANQLFEPVWNANYVDSVQITMAEDVGIGGRAGFYDVTGAARDVLQNHLLQLLALTAMEEPVEFTADAIRTEKLKVLRAIRLPLDLGSYAVRGQYQQGWLAGERVPAYTDEKDVPEDSKTETFAAVRLGIDTRRWAGVPFYLRTGKAMARRTTEIAIQFKQVPFALFRDTPVDTLTPNVLALQIQPDEGVSLQFGAKKPGPDITLGGVRMNFRYKDYFNNAPSTGYETLIYDCMIGDAMLFQRADSVEAGWAVVQPILDAWQSDKTVPLEFYPAGSEGPEGADQMLWRSGRHWRPVA